MPPKKKPGRPKGRKTKVVSCRMAIDDYKLVKRATRKTPESLIKTYLQSLVKMYT